MGGIEKNSHVDKKTYTTFEAVLHIEISTRTTSRILTPKRLDRNVGGQDPRKINRTGREGKWHLIVLPGFRKWRQRIVISIIDARGWNLCGPDTSVVNLGRVSQSLRTTHACRIPEDHKQGGWKRQSRWRDSVNLSWWIQITLFPRWLRF